MSTLLGRVHACTAPEVAVSDRVSRSLTLSRPRTLGRLAAPRPQLLHVLLRVALSSSPFVFCSIIINHRHHHHCTNASFHHRIMAAKRLARAAADRAALSLSMRRRAELYEVHVRALTPRTTATRLYLFAGTGVRVLLPLYMYVANVSVSAWCASATFMNQSSTPSKTLTNAHGSTGAATMVPGCRILGCLCPSPHVPTDADDSHGRRTPKATTIRRLSRILRDVPLVATSACDQSVRLLFVSASCARVMLVSCFFCLHVVLYLTDNDCRCAALFGQLFCPLCILATRAGISLVGRSSWATPPRYREANR